MTRTQYIEPALTMLERLRPMTEAAQPQLMTGDDIIPDEIFLLVPVLRARAQQGGLLEGTIVSVVDNVMQFLENMTGGGAAAPAAAAASAPGGPRASMSTNNDVSEAEIDRELAQLVAAIPALGEDFDVLSEQLGLPPAAVSFMRTAGAAGGARGFAKRYLIESIDKKGWDELRAALRDVRQQKPPLQLPHMDLVLQEGSAWNRAVAAVLGCPRVQLSRTQSFFASTVGLSGLVNLWSAAQQRRRQADARDPGHLSAASIEALQLPLNALCPVLEYQGFDDLPGVLSVVSATFTAQSLTRLLSDVSKVHPANKPPLKRGKMDRHFLM